jgi:hypothetical protein
MMTPEMRIAEAFDHVTRIAGERPYLQFQLQPSGTMLVVKGVIDYKYNPAIRYNVELGISGGFYSGELRVVSRSQSDALLSRLTFFYELWSQIEETCLHKRFSGIQLHYSIAGGRYRRNLMVLAAEDTCDPRGLGESIGLYLRIFDAALNLYFAAEQGVDMATFEKMQTTYSTYLDETPEVV